MMALILSGRGVQDQELVYPYYRLQEAGYKVTLAAESAGEFYGIQGVKFVADANIFSVRFGEKYDVLVIPGGVKCMEHLRMNGVAVSIVREHYMEGRVIGAICSGTQMLISAGIVKGKTISAYPAMRVDVENAGATYHDGPVALDGNIVTAPHYRNLGEWMKALLAEARSERWEGPACAAAA